ncbi:BEN domain-containing protein 5-like [Amphibalanus amphitrite]|uniref:BEN domain-containing protein 5-like n=1 Tax=Amphibalanus amphitrite TaxID=1232801 RepID=UPI001C918F0D|nr:BEN domain-containing protein 5-like [Amphibalanus amphitrite]
MFAYICYLRDNVKRVVPIKDIKDFHPRTVRDFDPTVIVRAYWRGLKDDIPYEEARRYNAQVLKLGETRESIATTIAAKRVHQPKIVPATDVTSMSSEEETDFEQETQKPASTRTPAQDAERQRLRDIVNRHHANAMDGSPDNDADTSCGEPSARSETVYREVVEQRDRYKTRCDDLQKQLSETKSALSELEGELEDTKKEMKMLRLLNAKYQVRIVKAVETQMRCIQEQPSRSSASNGGGCAPQRCESGKSSSTPQPRPCRPENPPRPLSQPELFSTEEQPGPAGDPGSPVSIRPDVLETIRGQRTASLMVKNMAVALWGTEGLANRSVTGSASNRTQGREPKQRLTPKKLEAIKSELRSQMTKRGADDAEVQNTLKKVPRFINEKIQDIRRKTKTTQQD